MRIQKKVVVIWKQEKNITDEAAANLREQNMNKGGLLTKPKRKPKKPRGKGLASK